MSRPRKQAYRSHELGELARQMLYAPPGKRAEVVRNAERFHDELDPHRNYPIDFLVYRLTGRRIPPSESVMLVGEALGPDVRLIIDTLSRSIDMPADPDDPGETTRNLAIRLGVSTKTVARWRDDGLRWRWGMLDPNQKPAVLITRSALQAFCDQHPDRVASASQFSQMSEAEKHRLISRARRLAQVAQVKPQAILNHLAKRSGRSVDALRQVIAKHDAAHPGQAVFADRAGPLTIKQKRLIARAYQRGVTVTAMCQRFGKTRSTIYRAVHEDRARRALTLKIDVVGSTLFDREDADEVLMHPIHRGGRRRRLDEEALAGLPEEIRAIYDKPLDPDRVTRSLIVRYNFIKHRVKQLQSDISEPPIRAGELERFDQMMMRMDEARAEVLAGTLPIVLSIVRRQIGAVESGDFTTLLSMIDQANAVLLHEIDYFDASLSHTFESVLTNRLLRELARPRGLEDPIDTEALLKRLYKAGLANGV